jgi:hypothetical protein
VFTLALAVTGLAAAQSTILVYDHNTANNYAQTAANNLSTLVTVAGEADFNTQLTSQAWDLVMIDCPSTIPAGGWNDVIAFVNGGGATVMAYWDWDAYPTLGPPFGYTSTTSFSLTDGVSTLTAAGTTVATTIFSGVPGMPHSAWFDNWGDDGDAFGFVGSTAIADLSDAPDPVVILNPSGNAIAAFVMDEWSGAGAVELWENMGSYVLGSTPTAAAVPVMSPLGMMLLVALIAGVGVFLIGRQRLI